MSPKRIRDQKDPELFLVNGIYYYRGTPTPGAKAIERTLSVKTRGLAIQAKKELLIEIRGLDPKKKIFPFSEVVKAIELEYERRFKAAEEPFKPKVAKTMGDFKWYVGKFLLPHFEHFPLSLITEDSWGEYIGHEIDEGRVRDFARDRRFMRQCLLHAQRSGRPVAMPQLRVPKYNRKKRLAITQDDADKINASATGIIKPLIVGMWTNFFRPGEVAGLRWARVNFEANTITLLEQDVKINARTVAISPEFRALLLEQKEKTGAGEFVFPSRGSTGRVYRWQKQWKRLCENLGLNPELDPYSTRHGALTNAARRIRKKIPDGNGNILTSEEVVKFAGTSLEVFEREYLKFTHEDTKEVASLNSFGVEL